MISILVASSSDIHFHCKRRLLIAYLNWAIQSFGLNLN